MVESALYEANNRFGIHANTNRNDPSLDLDFLHTDSLSNLAPKEILDSQDEFDLDDQANAHNSPQCIELHRKQAIRSQVVSTKLLPLYLGTIGSPSIGYQTIKRSLDILISLSLLALLTPLFLLVGVLIKMTDGGPVFFRQVRVGIRGNEFYFFKFRSMIVNAESMKEEVLPLNKHRDSITFKMIRDPRITWIGRIIRKTSIDELPQLWNVLLGEMTLVGPRPAVPSEVARYSLYERRRLNTVPGLTCIWQVSGRADLDFRQQVDLDLQYIRERSFWLDLKLLLLTIPAVLSGKGAY